MPVLAVTEITPGFFAFFFLRAAMIARRSRDFPVPVQKMSVTSQKAHRRCHERCACIPRYMRPQRWIANAPAEPVKKTFFPSCTTIFKTLICSSFSETCSIFRVSLSGVEDAATCGEKNVSNVRWGCFAVLSRPSSISPVDLRFLVVVLEGEVQSMLAMVVVGRERVVSRRFGQSATRSDPRAQRAARDRDTQAPACIESIHRGR